MRWNKFSNPRDRYLTVSHSLPLEMSLLTEMKPQSILKNPKYILIRAIKILTTTSIGMKLARSNQAITVRIMGMSKLVNMQRDLARGSTLEV